MLNGVIYSSKNKINVTILKKIIFTNKLQIHIKI